MQQVYDGLKEATAGLNAKLASKQKELLPWSKKLNEARAKVDVGEAELKLLQDKVLSRNLHILFIFPYLPFLLLSLCGLGLPAFRHNTQYNTTGIFIFLFLIFSSPPSLLHLHFPLSLFSPSYPPSLVILIDLSARRMKQVPLLSISESGSTCCVFPSFPLLLHFFGITLNKSCRSRPARTNSSRPIAQLRRVRHC